MTKFLHRLLNFSLLSYSVIIASNLLIPTNVWAAGVNEEIFINADHMRLSIQSGKSVYTGKVKIVQGKLVLTGNEITVQQQNNTILHITILGKPARYHNTTEEGEIVIAESEKMIYNANQDKLIMTTNAILQQPDHSVRSQKIIYDTKKRIIIAGDKDLPAKSSSSTDNNRVKITLTPQKQAPSKN